MSSVLGRAAYNGRCTGGFWGEKVFACFSKEYQNKGLMADNSLKECENKGVTKSTLRVHTKEYQNKGLKRFCPCCGVELSPVQRRCAGAELRLKIGRGLAFCPFRKIACGSEEVSEWIDYQDFVLAHVAQHIENREVAKMEVATY